MNVLMMWTNMEDDITYTLSYMTIQHVQLWLSVQVTRTPFSVCLAQLDCSCHA